MSLEDVLEALEILATTEYRQGMARFAVPTEKALGVKMPDVRALAKKIKKNHQLALDLWATEVHEARILAGLIADPTLLEERTMDEWVAAIYSWDVCDQCCGNLFWKKSFAHEKALMWAKEDAEFTRRAGFVLMLYNVMKNKQTTQNQVLIYLDYIEKYAFDDRNFVKKAINWALRTIGKKGYLDLAIACADRIKMQGTPSAKWIANDAIRELENR